MSPSPWLRALAGLAPAAIYLCALSAQQPAALQQRRPAEGACGKTQCTRYPENAG